MSAPQASNRIKTSALVTTSVALDIPLGTYDLGGQYCIIDSIITAPGATTTTFYLKIDGTTSAAFTTGANAAGIQASFPNGLPCVVPDGSAAPPTTSITIVSSSATASQVTVAYHYRRWNG